MANESLTPARFELDGHGVPRSLDYDDVYYSADGGLAETDHVFLQGNGLPERWLDRERFVIGEIGFGTGQNVLAAARLFLDTAPGHARLHLVTVEKHPIPKDDLKRLYPAGHPLADLASELIAHYPDLIPGSHRVELASGRIVLTLLFGDALEILPRARAQVDAWFLDGFAPAKNPTMWQPPLFETMARLSAPGATCATFSCARMVREGLAAAGFAVQKCKGFGRKREMLVGRLVRRLPAEDDHPPWFPRGRTAASREAVVIGAGIAGASVARRLAERGWTVRVLERHALPAQEASGNHAGILLPVLSAQWNDLSRLTSLGLGYARRTLDRLAIEHPGIDWHPTGVLRLARNERHAAQQLKIATRLNLPTDFARWVDPKEGSRLIGARVEQPGWWFARGGWVSPSHTVRALLDHPGIELATSVAVKRIEHIGENWRLLDDTGACVAESETLILANACALNTLLPGALPLAPVRGQISLTSAVHGRSLNAVACREGYVIPVREGLHCFGASFTHGLHDPAPRIEDHLDNLKRLESILPDWNGLDPDSLEGRVSHRCATSDRLPIAGPLHDAQAFRQDFDCLHFGWPARRFRPARLHPGLWVTTGHGARGLVWSALLGELIASALAGDPLPLTVDLVHAVHPARFDYRQMRLAPEHRQPWVAVGED
ncbi:MAG: bifunctional tRNA (5-methylaminomethyl-2-thiouridine)(34)-methyltransferase MnmD/FAD-dependent 5-carboxymethylaminomethyl-2-thiouridine(34) oxidoreductase MnmC [Halothiobacillaceae bacterium]